MPSLNVLCLQMPVLAEKVQKNLDWVLEKLKGFSSGKIDLVCLPEMWTTDFPTKDTEQLARETDHAWGKIGLEAKRLGATFCGSALEMAMVGKKRLFFNTAQLYFPNGEKPNTCPISYRKIHLFRPLDEHKNFAAGRDLVLAPVKGVNLGLTICYDLRFPEPFRALARRGAQIILVPSAWPHSRRGHWRILLQARAIENQVFIIGVNRVGKSAKGFDFAGSSMVVDPWGEILWEAGDQGEEVHLVSLDLAKIYKIREKITVWQDERLDLYQIWLKEDLPKR